ncbi:MAG: hypothetical protein GF416_04730 [Candidatus Altiarchaeales archaeon]|nr:hypothetical protein [Candidatus Altiarchaeales archaeon]MBD3416425.1 hypothetical protein [Candidatus Altiarchaeales archaeon]
MGLFCGECGLTEAITPLLLTLSVILPVELKSRVERYLASRRCEVKEEEPVK